MLETDDPRLRSLINPLQDLTFERGQVRRTFRSADAAQMVNRRQLCVELWGPGADKVASPRERNSPSTRIVEAPIVRILVPADQRQAKDVFGDGTNAVVGVTLMSNGRKCERFVDGKVSKSLRCRLRPKRGSTQGQHHTDRRRPPVLGDKAAREIVDGLRRPTELSQDLVIGQSRHLRALRGSITRHNQGAKNANARTYIGMAPRMGADVTSAGQCLSENRRIIDNIPPDEEVRRRLILVLEEAVECRGVFERLSSTEERRSAAARVQR